MKEKALGSIPNQEFWKSKKVFITGHTGFKGGWLSLWLNHLGAKVTGFSLPPNTEPCIYNVCSIENTLESIIEDVRNYNQLKEALLSVKPDIVIHMAAQALVLDSYKFPVETYETNLMGTVNILNAIRVIPSIKAFVNVTSDKCYENTGKIAGYKEVDPMGGFDPYSSSKGCAELITSAYRSSFFNNKRYVDHGVAVATARSGNVIGGGDWSENRLIPDFFKSISLNKTTKIRNPNAIRPWQHVLEPLRGYLMLAENLFLKGSDFAEAWNFGPELNDIQTVEWMISEIASQWGDGPKFQIKPDSDQPHEATFLGLDCSKSSKRLNWASKLDNKETISLTCDWYKNFYNGNNNMQSFTLEQIKKYECI